MQSVLENNFNAHRNLLTAVMADEALKAHIAAAAQALCACLQSGGKVLLCGNGGSAADAIHITAELVGCFEGMEQPLAAICLNSNAENMTSIANDSDFRYIFSKQVEALAQPRDILIALTTSGKSENILEALAAAKQAGAVTITLCGERTDCIESDYVLAIPSGDTPRVQEMHLFIGHCFAQYVKENMSKEAEDG